MRRTVAGGPYDGAMRTSWLVLVTLGLVACGEDAKPVDNSPEGRGARDLVAAWAQAAETHAQREQAYPVSLQHVDIEGNAYSRPAHMPPKDPWGAFLQYRLLDNGKRFQLRSLGADGKPDTDDDIQHTGTR